MIKAVIFDMFETLVTLFESPVYFGKQIAADMGISEPVFRRTWDDERLENDRFTGKLTLEEEIKLILEKNECYSTVLFEQVVSKRKACQKECLNHLHPQIIPLLEKLKQQKIRVGLVSNCYSEEVPIIRESVMFPYFDAACLSYEEGLKKPDREIFDRCVRRLGVKAEECLYVGDGGSLELETATALGMKAVQATWYFKEGTLQPVGRKKEFLQAESPLEILRYL